MGTPATHGQLRFGKRALLILSALVAFFIMFATANPPPASATTTYDFCNVTLAPYGQYGDRCYSWGGGDLAVIAFVTYERSGCVTTANGNGDLIQSWKCFPNGSAPGGYHLYFGDHIYRKPVIRNNNLSYKGYFEGGYTCYTPC
jgi:hypothetical protein